MFSVRGVIGFRNPKRDGSLIMSLVTWQGKLLLTNGKLTLGPAAAACCCEGTPCCPNEPTGPLLLTFTSDCADIDGHTIEVPRDLDAWRYNYAVDGADPVLQDVVIEIVCVVDSGKVGAASYKLSLSSGCLSNTITNRYADGTSTCDPFTLDFADLDSGTLTSECFACIDPGESFTYSIQATEAP